MHPGKNTKWILLPALGIGLYVLLYIIATFLYPGGSDINRAAAGFSWQHNYWCELMADYAQNGQVNTARPVAITAMFLLGISLTLFWYFASFLFRSRSPGRILIRYAGILSMLTMVFLLFAEHDPVINTAGALGMTALITVTIGLYKKRNYTLAAMGILCVLLSALNNYIYFTNELYYLPVIQKISFAVFLFWFIRVSFYLYRRQQESLLQPTKP
ncbi:MAG: hypothetical protein J0L56_18450 [Chitinophagales bacterium]|nr:hypothetical protein [Chitinophagales bacterium]